MTRELLILVIPGLLAATLSWVLTPVTVLLARRVGAMDEPGERKVHTRPIPRLGGLAVLFASFLLLAALSFLPFAPPNHFEPGVLFGFILGMAPIAVVSFFDDVRGVRVATRFGMQALGATAAVFLGFQLGADIHVFGSTLHLGWVAIPLSILWIVGVTNAFNLIDGLDGLSAGLALISAVSLAAVSVIVGRYATAMAAVVLAGALVGFLPFNLYPARVFLGDTGATVIGFYLACLALRGGSTLTNGMAILIPVVVLGIPIADTLIAMARRAMRRFETDGGTGMFDADRRHFHHRLLELGLNQQRAVLTLYAVGVLLAACGFASVFMSNRGAALLLVTLLTASLIGLRRLGYDEFAIVKRGVVLRIYDSPVLKSGLFAVFTDLAMVVAALAVAMVLKYENLAFTQYRPLAAGLVTILPPVTLVVFYLFRLYRGTWRMASADDLVRSSKAVVVASAAGFAAAWLTGGHMPSRTLFLIYALVLLALVNGVRSSYRLLSYVSRRAMASGEPVLVYGAGIGGTMAVREMLANPEVGLKPVGFVDDDPSKRGKLVNGYPVLGSVEDVVELLAKGTATGIVVATEKVSEQRMARLRWICGEVGGTVRTFRMDFETLGSEGFPEGGHIAEVVQMAKASEI
ncbi:MAG: hypothetical protein WBX15_03045 [Thermoanaerobaculia bacterium]